MVSTERETELLVAQDTPDLPRHFLVELQDGLGVHVTWGIGELKQVYTKCVVFVLMFPSKSLFLWKV